MALIGIDLGMSAVRAAAFRKGKASIIRTPNGGDAVSPNVASSPDGVWHVGYSANKCLKVTPGAVGYSFPTLFYERLLRPDDEGSDLQSVPALSEEGLSTQLLPAEIAALVLAKIKANAEIELGEPVEKAVVAVSGALNFRHYQTLRDAGRLCGLELVRVLPATSARAVAHCLSAAGEKRVVMLDVIDGYVEAGCAEIGNGVVDMKAFAAVRLASDVADEKQALANSAILATCDVKWQLTAALKQVLQSAGLGDQSDACIVVIGDTLSSVAGLSEAVAALVGSSAEVVTSSRRQVALGAAIQGAAITGDEKDILLLDIVPHTVALETAGGIATPMIPTGTTWPTKRVQVFSTFRDNDTSLSFNVVQGANTISSKNVLLGTFVYDRIAAAPRGEPRVEFTLEVRPDGVLFCSAKEAGKGDESMLTIRLPRELEITHELKARMRERLDNLSPE